MMMPARRKSRYEGRLAEERIIRSTKEHESGVKTGDGCCGLALPHEALAATGAKRAGLDVNGAKRMGKLKSENAKLEMPPAGQASD